MPLLKKTPFPLLDPPEGLDTEKAVYHVRFTKEIFVDYDKYLSRMKLYQQRIWTCKVTGKTNLTYEEALVSEEMASQKIQNIPKDLISLALPIIQYSVLSLKDLSEKICLEYRKRKELGTKVLGKLNNSTCLCSIVSIREEGEKYLYKVAWLDKSGNVTETSEVCRDDLIMKRNPFSKKKLKSFIRGSTTRSGPWIIHQSLATEYNISSNPPESLKHNNSIINGDADSKKEKRGYDEQNDTEEGSKLTKKIKIVYPIEDTLVEPILGDSANTDRPVSSKKFISPMECVGGVLMIWNFFSSFGKLIHLFPFSLEDFEQSLLSYETVPNIITEAHIALLRFLKNHQSQFSMFIQKSNKLSKISNNNWTKYLYKFLEMLDRSQFEDSLSLIKRENYGSLNVKVKVEILTELVNEALDTELFREVLVENVQHRHVIEATKKEISLQEARIKRNEVKVKSSSNASVFEITANGVHYESTIEKQELNFPAQDTLDQSKIEPSPSCTKLEDENDHKNESSKGNSKKEVLKQMKEEKLEVAQKRSKEQRVQYFEREMEKRVLRATCLGKDKHRNRYWLFQRDARIFVESFDFKTWGFYSTVQEFDLLLGSLNPKGVREKALQTHLLKYNDKIRLGLKKKCEALAHKMAREDAVLRRSTRVRATQVHGYINKWK